MRRPRIKAEGEGFYHVVSRIGGKRFLMDDGEKRILLSLVRAAAAFSGVELLTYAVMDNHFHLLVRVPQQRTRISGKELAKRIRALCGEAKSAKLFAQWDKWKNAGAEGRVKAEQTRFLSRMGDLSQFVKTFKEAYTQSYNRRHGNTGTIWEGRFKSILLEGSYRTLMTVAGYIHLNPVRAKMAETPEEAPFTGYGAACAGDDAARRGLEALVSQAFGRETSWPEARSACGEVMDGALAAEESEESSLQVRTEPGAEAPPSGSRPLYDLLRHRRPDFLHGGILGRAAFLQRVAGKLLPPRRRRKREGELDRFRDLGFRSALGVRAVS